MNNLSIKEIFSISWKDTKKSWKFILALIGMFTLLGFLDGMFGYSNDPFLEEESGSMLFSFIYQLLVIYLSAGFIAETIKISDGKKPCLKRIFTWPINLKHGLKYFASYIVYSILILLPFIVFGVYIALNINNTVSILGVNDLVDSLVLPAVIALLASIILSVFIGPAYYLMIENRNGIFSNIKKSFVMVRSNIWFVIKWTLSSIALITIPFAVMGLSITMFLGNYTPNGMELPSGVVWGLSIASILSLIGAIIIGFLLSISYSHLYRNIDSEVKKIEE